MAFNLCVATHVCYRRLVYRFWPVFGPLTTVQPCDQSTLLHPNGSFLDVGVGVAGYRWRWRTYGRF